MFFAAREIAAACLNSCSAPYTRSQTRPKSSSSTIFAENSQYWLSTHIVPFLLYWDSSQQSCSCCSCCRRQYLHSAACFCALGLSGSLLRCVRLTSAVSRWCGSIPASSTTTFKIRLLAALSQSRRWWRRLPLSSDLC